MKRKKKKARKQKVSFGKQRLTEKSVRSNVFPPDIEHELTQAVQFYTYGNLEKAEETFRKILRLVPNHAGSLYFLSDIAYQTGKADIALKFLKKAVKNDPQNPIYHFNMGNLLNNLGRFKEALPCYQKAIELNPHHAEAWVNMGLVFDTLDDQDESIACYRKAVEAEPDSATNYVQLILKLMATFSWQELKTLTAKLDYFTRKSLDSGKTPVETPFISFAMHEDPRRNLAVSKAWSSDISTRVSALRKHFSFKERTSGRKKITIGYISNDFRNHPVAQQILGLFALHNRDEFEIFCFSWGPDDKSHYRKRIQQDCDKFVELQDVDDTSAAKIIYDHHVDILVDLMGYTEGNRLEICAFRPAPIQVAYLGFPGTTGATFVDYIITDKVVTPENHRSFYTEAFVFMPHCYMITDHMQSVSQKRWERTDFGLREDSFVFCSFNKTYKIEPLIFGTWMSILDQVPHSTLWLRQEGSTAEKNLRHEANSRGINPERLVFSPKLPSKADHLARLKLADLALDTRIYNGHTTTCDALWAGVPVVTLQDSLFASRVSSSMLKAIGLPELITRSLSEYEGLAINLARNQGDLKALRNKVAENRSTEPLFDTPRFVKNVEKAYKEMWKIFLAGETPRQIEVLE
jgi:protein O-GlcNAc transferase